jgi:hypothetical protein
MEEQNLTFAEIFKKTYWIIFLICLASSVVSIYLLPQAVRGNLSEQEINQELSSLDYMGATSLSPEQIISSLISTFDSLMISTVLLIIAYIIKYIIDKRLFSIGKWRDWRFFLYISGIIFIETYAFSIPSAQTNFALNLFLILVCSLITVALSKMLLPQYLTNK